MAHNIVFKDYDDPLLTKQQVIDLINTLFVGPDSFFTIHGKMEKGRPSSYVGLAWYNEVLDEHEIHLAFSRMRKHQDRGSKGGGDIRLPNNLNLIAASVLSHELMHSMQFEKHSIDEKSFWGKKKSKYRTRACEREAREFATKSIGITARVIGVEWDIKSIPQNDGDTVEDVAELLAECVDISTRDIIDELKLSGINNAVNVGKVKEILKSLMETTDD